MTKADLIVRAAASACVFRGETVLLVQRGKPPYDGIWSLPGGSVELGETAQAAAERELAEETGLTCRLNRPAGVNDVILRDSDGAVTMQYVISVFTGECGPETGDPVAQTDARAARFVPLETIADYQLGRRVSAIVMHAYGLVRGG